MAEFLRVQMEKVVAAHGHAAPVLELAARVGWQARWYSQDKAARIAEVVRKLTEAGEELGRLEAEDRSEES